MKSSRSSSRPHGYPGPSWQWSSWSNRAARPGMVHRIHRLAMRRRRLLAALLLCLAAAVSVQQLTPSTPATQQVVVAARDLPAGHILGSNDLAGSAVAPAMVPDGALENGGTAWLERQLSGPVRRGEVITDASFLGSELLVGAPAGTQAVPLRVSDPASLSLLRQGQLVTVVLSLTETLDGPVHNEILANGVPVLWTPEPGQSSGGLLPAQDVAGMVVVAASPGQALELAGASSRGKVFLILVP